MNIKMHKTLLFASESIGKFNEIHQYIKQFTNMNLVKFKTIDEINEIQSLDRTAIVKNKLLMAYKDGVNSHLLDNLCSQDGENWLFVEDTSLCIDKMGGFPGPFIKFYLESLPLQEICNANAYSPAQSIVNIAACKIQLSKGFTMCNLINVESVIDGVIAGSSCGNNGFGYDKIFIPCNNNSSNVNEISKLKINVNTNLKTYAEMTMDEKHKMNPRIMAIEKLLSYL